MVGEHCRRIRLSLKMSPPSAVVAFSVAYHQNKQLIGERGLMPCGDYLRSVKRYVGGRIGAAAFAYAPTVLWLVDWGDMDANLDGVALAGMALAAFVLVTGMANMVVMVTLWGLYHSLVGVGQLWWVWWGLESKSVCSVALISIKKKHDHI